MREVEFEPYILTDEVDIYAIKAIEEKETEFYKFYRKFIDSSDNYIKDDLARIIKILEQISENGAKESYFRIEGNFSDRVYAIPLLIIRRNINKHGTLRLYCLRVSNELLILGGGDIKYSRTYEENTNLIQIVLMLQSLDRALMDLETDGADLKKEIMNLVLKVK